MQRPIVVFSMAASGSICHHLQSLQRPHELSDDFVCIAVSPWRRGAVAAPGKDNLPTNRYCMGCRRRVGPASDAALPLHPRLVGIGAETHQEPENGISSTACRTWSSFSGQCSEVRVLQLVRPDSLYPGDSAGGYDGAEASRSERVILNLCCHEAPPIPCYFGHHGRSRTRQWGASIR
jgi:hypothetical protein